MTFAKIFHSIFDSSIAEDPDVRHLFMDLLVLADKSGCVDMTIGSIAARTRLSKDHVSRCIAVLESPDPDSRTTDEEGRRIVRLDPNRSWGWRITNFRRYLESASAEMVRMSESERKREWRARRGYPPPAPPRQRGDKEEIKSESETCPLPVPDCPGQSGKCPGPVPDKQPTADTRTPPEDAPALELKPGTGTEKPTIEDAISFAKAAGVDDSCVTKWFHEAESRGWVDRTGQPIVRWQASLRAYAESWAHVERRQHARENQPKLGKESTWERKQRLEAIEERIGEIRRKWLLEVAGGPEWSASMPAEARDERARLIQERKRLKAAIRTGGEA